MFANLYNPRFKGARCVSCERYWSGHDFPFTCPDCGPLKGTLDIIYDFDREPVYEPANEFISDLWNWKDFLPVNPPDEVRRLRVGATPIIRTDFLMSEVGIMDVWLKDDRLNPSGSLKDRASAVGLAHAIAIESDVIAAASTGNAASSLATLAASCNMPVVLFVPEAAPEAKLVQLLIHGAHVVRIRGTYDDAFDVCAKICETHDWYSRNTATNPFLTEGKKTVILEALYQMNWALPDIVMVPVGDGCILGAVHKGLVDLEDAGFIDRMPRLFGVQAKGAAPLIDGKPALKAIEVSSFADSIAVGLPRDQMKALRAVKETRGEWVAVSDDDIRQAMVLLAQKVGIFSEPAGAAALAGLIEARQEGRIHEQDTVLVLVTGHGLKDIKSAFSAVPQAPEAVEPTMDAVEKALRRYRF